MVSKPRVISSSGRDVTGTSATSRGSSSSSSSSRDTSTSPMAKKGTSSRDDPRKIKTTAERQAEERREAGGGKDYSDIPEGTAVTREKQAEAVRESYEKGSKQYEQEKQKYTEDINRYAQTQGPQGLTSEQLQYVNYGQLLSPPRDTSKTPMAQNGVRQRFNIPQYQETPMDAGRTTRKNIQMEEQRLREQPFRAQEAMSLAAQKPTLQVERGPALTVARSKQPEFEKAATGYEQRVGSALSPLTTSTSPVLQFAGGAAETVAYAPTGIPRLALGLAREPTAVVGETARTQVETLRTQPARGLGQISAMLVGPKAVRGAARTFKTRVPISRTLETLEGRAMRKQFEARYETPTQLRRRQLPETPVTVGTVRKTSPGTIDVTTVLKDSLEPTYRGGEPRGVTTETVVARTAGTGGRRGVLSGTREIGGRGPIEMVEGVRGRTVELPDILSPKKDVRYTYPEIDAFKGIRTRRTRVTDDRPFVDPEMQQLPRYPAEQVKMGETLQLVDEPTGPYRRVSSDPTIGVFERPTQQTIKTVSDEGILYKRPTLKRRRVKTGAGRLKQRGLRSNVAEFKQVRDSGERGFGAFLRSEEAQLRPTQAVRPQTQQVGRPVFGDAFRTATQRRGAVFQRGRIVSRSESRLGAIGTVGLAASVASGVEQGTSPTQIDFTIPTSITRPVTAQTQPQIQRTTTPQIQRQVPVSPLRTTTPTRTVPRTPTVRQPKMPEPVIPRALPRKKKETDKKKRGRKTGFEFYDVENPLAGFEQVFKNVGGKK
jgi:hypothetical protein